MITIEWGTTYTINIPQSYLTLISGTFYQLDTDQFRLDLKTLEASFDGMPYTRTHNHNTDVTIAGTTFARTVEIIAPYNVTFENGAYSVQLVGSNNNIFDIGGGILNQNFVQVIPTNSAGLQTVVQGSGITEQDKLDIADRVWDETQSEHVAADTMGLSQDQVDLNPTEVADSVWNALSADHLTIDSFGSVIQRLLEDISYPITSTEVLGETHLTIWTDVTLTTPLRIINIGTSDVPKRVDITP